MIDTTALIATALDHVYMRFFGRTLPFDELRALIGIPLYKQAVIFGSPESFGTTIDAVMNEFIAYYEENRSKEIILTDVVNVLIDGKRRGCPTGLVTSKNREELANSLPRLGIADFIDSAITADDIPSPKPAPDGILISLERLGFADRKHEVVYIGDTVHDMRAARAAGIPSIAVTWGAAPRDLLSTERPTYLCDSPEQLSALL